MIDSPNHGLDWTPLEEMELVELFDASISLVEICSTLGRRPNAVISRLIKLDCLVLVEAGSAYRVVRAENWATVKAVNEMSKEYEP